MAQYFLLFDTFEQTERKRIDRDDRMKSIDQIGKKIGPFKI